MAAARRWLPSVIVAAGWIWLVGCLLLGWLLSPELAPEALFDVAAAAGFIIAYGFSRAIRANQAQE